MAASAVKNNKDNMSQDIADKINKVYNCAECGVMFSTALQQVHEEQTHGVRGIKRPIDEPDVKEQKIYNSEEFIKETYPYIEDGKGEEEAESITFKGKSRKYIAAYNKLREKMVEEAEF